MTPAMLDRQCFLQNGPVRHHVEYTKHSRTAAAGKQLRKLSSESTSSKVRLEPCGLQLENFHARDIFKEALNSVEPKHMVENVLQFEKQSSVLTVNDNIYHLNHNVYVVGFGKAVLGMARATEDILGEHVVSGILIIPRGLQQTLQEKGQR